MGFGVAGAGLVGEFVGLIVGLVVGRDDPGAAVIGAEVAGASIPVVGFFVGVFVGLVVGRVDTGFAVVGVFVGVFVGLSDAVGGFVLDGRIFTSEQFQNSTVTEEYEVHVSLSTASPNERGSILILTLWGCGIT